jgi:hypothetical protein
MTSRSKPSYRIPPAGALEELGDARSGPGIAQQVESDTTQVIGAEGLGQEGVGTTAVCSLAGLLLSMCREHQHFQVAGAGIASNSFQDFPPVHPRESDIENQEGRRVLQGRFETARSIVARLDLYPCGAETDADKPLDDHRVFHDENALRHDKPFLGELARTRTIDRFSRDLKSQASGRIGLVVGIATRSTNPSNWRRFLTSDTSSHHGE